MEGTQEHGIATIWDADILIWAASQIVEARDAGIPTSRLMQVRPYEILHRARYAARLPAPQGRARPAAIDHGGHVHPRNHGTATAPLRGSTSGRNWPMPAGTPLGIELILPDWFYAGVVTRPWC